MSPPIRKANTNAQFLEWFQQHKSEIDNAKTVEERNKAEANFEAFKDSNPKWVNKLPSTGGYGSDRQQPTYDVGGYKQTDYETGGFKQQEQDKGGQSKSPKKKEGHGATGNEDEDKKEGDGKKGGAGTSRSRR